QADADLLAVRTMIPRVATLRQRIALGEAFEVRTGHVVEQQIVFEREQRAELVLQMGLQPGLVCEQAIEPAIATVVIDLGFRDAEQVVERRAAEPVLGDVQLARWLAESSDNEHRSHGGPRYVFPTGRQKFVQ